MLKMQWEISTLTYTLDSDSIHGDKAGMIQHVKVQKCIVTRMILTGCIFHYGNRGENDYKRYVNVQWELAT